MALLICSMAGGCGKKSLPNRNIITTKSSRALAVRNSSITACLKLSIAITSVKLSRAIYNLFKGAISPNIIKSASAP